MNRTYNLKLDLQFRCNNSNMEFWQFDENTSDFYIRITDSGQLFDIEKAIVILAIIKPSGKVDSQFIEVENGLLYADLKPSMKDEVGNYQAKALLIFEDEKLTTDIVTYTVNADNILSSLNLAAATTQEFTLLTDMLSRLSTIENAEILRVANEEAREILKGQVNVLKTDLESLQVTLNSLETNTSANEQTRQSNEQTRQTLKASMETLKTNLESLQVSLNSLEANVTTNEQARQTLKGQMDTLKSEIEALRITLNTNEATRQSNEEARQLLKSQMDSLKTNLVTLKSSLEALSTEVTSNENTRIEQEQSRQALKSNLESLKNSLEALENSLNNNEATRGTTFTSKISEINNKIAEINNKISETTTMITNTNIAKSNAEIATTNANNKIFETEATRQSIIATINNLVAQFNSLAPANSTNAEVQLARTDVTGKTYASLQERLLADNKQQNILYASVEGTYISTESTDGEVKNLQILGNTYQDPSTLAKILSTGTKLADGRFEIPLLTCGKNIFDGLLEGGFMNNTTGVNEGTMFQTRSTNYTKVNPNSIMTQSNSSNLAIRVHEYDKDKKYIKNQGLINANSNFQVSSTTVYIRFVIATTTTDTTIKVQIEYGTVVTSFEKYQENKLTILSDVQIEKTGSIPDRIIQLSDGKWYVEKSIITMILNENSSISRAPTLDSTNTYRYIINLSGTNVAKSSASCICDRIITTTVSTFREDITNMYIHNSDGSIHIKQLNTDTRWTDLATLKTWLSQNNTLVKYPLAIPIFIPLPDDQQVALRTFNNKTNILSLCEIEPTIKADIPKSLGASVNSINTRLDNVDKDLERVKRLEDATNSTVVTDKDFVNISETSNGYLSDVKLEGRTLNQIVTNGNFANGTTGWVTSGSTINATNNILTITGAGATTYVGAYRNTDVPCNTDKKIFVKTTFKLKNSNCTSFKLLVQGTLGGSTTSQITILNPTIDTLYTVYSIITLDSSFLGNVRVLPTSYYIDATTATGKVMEVQNVMALDLTALGMTNYTADEINGMMNGYFEGLKSVGQDATKIVVSSIKGDGNLFDINLLNDYITATNGNEIIIDYVKLSSKIMPIKCKSNTQHIFKYKCKELIGSKKPRFRFAYSDGTFSDITILQISSTMTEYYATSTLGKTVIGISASYSSAGGTWVVDNGSILFNEGTTPITYRPIEIDKKEILYLDTVDSTWKKPTFRGIWNNGVLTVGDIAEKKADGKYSYSKRMSEKVLNGSENWLLWTGLTDETNTKGFMLVMSDLKPNVGSTGATAIKNITSDKFAWKDMSVGQIDEEKIITSTSNTLYIRINKSKLATQDVVGLKAYLATNPVTIVYQLLAELTYECTPIDVASYDNETNYTLECGVLSPRSTIKVSNFIGNIINELKEKVSIQENQNSLMRVMLLNHEARLILGGH